jgi:hypothetical protein
MTDQADAHELNQEQPEAPFVDAHERRQQPARHDDMDRIAARAAQLRREAAGIATPPGYRIAESGIPGVPPKYEVLLGAGRAEQFIGMRDSREEATGLTHLHHSRIQAERANATARHTPGPPAPRR